MLNVGLTGGIGAGKSAVAARLVTHGGVLIDSDRLAREVVEPGTDGLAMVAEAFGAGVLTDDGALDRAALASRVFGDPSARRSLESIIHPRVRDRSAELLAAAPDDAIVVHDIPLLAEVGLAPTFDLVLVVTADRRIRLERLELRGLPGEQARARIAAQTGDDTRAAVADVVIDNSGTLDALNNTVDALWRDRLVPFETHKRERRIAQYSGPVRIVDPDPEWPGRYRRIAARLRHLLGDRIDRIDHIGSTAVPGLPAKDLIDVQVSVRDLDVADGFADVLAAEGFPRFTGITSDNPRPFAPDPARWPKRLHGGTDPAAPCHLHVRVTDSPGWRYALAGRDYLREHPADRDEYAAHKRRLAARFPDHDAYSAAKEPWFDGLCNRVIEWIGVSGWDGPAADD